MTQSAHAMDFHILGPLEVRKDGDRLALGGPKQRALLAILLLNAGQVVSRDRLIEELWADEPPAAARHALEVHVSRLRKALGADGSEGPALLTRSPGYVLNVEPGQLDLQRFERLLADGRQALADGDPARSARALRAAQGLWRGRPLADLEFEPFARVDIERREELRRVAMEERIEADLALGRHADLIAELEPLVSEHPLRERARGQLMLALYRCDRQAEALEAYRHGRRHLVEELALEPSPTLQRLQQAILCHDPGLDLTPFKPQAAPALAEPGRVVLPTSSRRRFGRRPVAATALAVAAVAAAAGVLALGGSGSRHPAAVRVLPPVPDLIDAGTGKPIASIRSLAGAADARFGAGGFWTVNPVAHTLARIDPATGAVTKQIASPVNINNQGSFAVHGNDIWVADWSGPNVYKLDARTGFAQLHLRLSHRRFDTRRTLMLGVGSGAVWAGVWRTGELVQIDAATGTILRRVHGFPGVDGGAVGDGSLWVSTPDALTRIDLQTYAVAAVAKIPGPHQFLALGGGFTWTANPYRGEVYKVDARGHVAATYRTGLGAWRLAYLDGTLWVGNDEPGTLTGINAVTGNRRTYHVGRVINAMSAGAGRLLALALPFQSVVAIPSSLKRRGVRLIVPAYVGDPEDPATAVSEQPDTVGENPFMLQIEHATEVGLLNHPDAPPPAGLRLQPEVAAAMPTMSRDRRTYTFRIRRGYRFAPPSGAAVTAETFRASIERALSPRLGADAPGIDYLGDVVGARAYHAGRARHVRGLRARGARLSITLTRPSADFVERLSLSFFSPVPVGSPIAPNGEVNSNGALPPPSAGPYYMTAHLGAAVIVLKRNPYYTGARPHSLETIAFLEGIPAEDAVRRILRGEFDGVEVPDPGLAPGGVVARRYAGPGAPGGLSYAATPLEQTRYIALNARYGVFSDDRLRRSAARALSRGALAAAWGFSTDGDPNTGRPLASGELLPPNVRGYRPSDPYPLDPDLTRAPLPARRVALARMAIPAGCDECLSSFQQVKAALAPLGIAVRARRVASLAAAKRQPRRFDLYDGVTALPYPDPSSFLAKMLGKDIPRAWLPAETDAALSRLAKLRGRVRDGAAIALAGRLERRDVPVMAYGHPVIGELYSSRVGCRVRPGYAYGLELAALCVR